MASILRSSSLLPLSGISIASPETPRSLPSLPTKQRAQVRPLRVNPSTCIAKAIRFYSFIPSAASRQPAKLQEAEETEAQDIEEKPTDDGAVVESIPVAEEKLPSTVMTFLEAYKEALADNDQSKIAEIEAFLQSIEDEKTSLEEKVDSLSEEFLVEKDRILRISADFDNFRKRTEREKLSLVENVRCEVLENLLPVLDNFERAKNQIKVETQGEEKINNSYQSIYKQFLEILTSLGVKPIETVGNAFDPMLHEAIMREESLEFEEGIILQEFRRGFKLGEKLLRPSMVKVSAGPGPAKPKEHAEAEAEAEAEVDGSNEEVDQEEIKEGGDAI